jgi:hypothetical protein
MSTALSSSYQTPRNSRISTVSSGSSHLLREGTYRTPAEVSAVKEPVALGPDVSEPLAEPDDLSVELLQDRLELRVRGGSEGGADVSERALQSAVKSEGRGRTLARLLSVRSWTAGSSDGFASVS